MQLHYDFFDQPFEQVFSTINICSYTKNMLLQKSALAQPAILQALNETCTYISAGHCKALKE